jgi:hypothetical protein
MLTNNYSIKQAAYPTSFSQVDMLPHTFQDVFEPVLFNQFTRVFSNSLSEPSKRALDFKSHLMVKTEQSRLHTATIDASFHILHWTNYNKSQKGLRTTHPNVEKQVAAINADHSFPILSVSGGALLIDNALVPHANISRSQILWSRPLKEKGSEVWEHGALHVSGDSSIVHGAIALGAPISATSTEKPLSANAVVRVMGLKRAVDHYLLSSAKSPTNEGTFESTHAADYYKYPGEMAWTNFHLVEHGIEEAQPGSGVRVSAVMPDLDRNWTETDLNLYSVTAVLLPGYILMVTITITPGLESLFVDLMAPGKWKPAPGREKDPIPPTFHDIVLNINLATNVVQGHYTELLGSDDIGWQAGSLRAIYCQKTPKIAALKARSLQVIAKSSLQTEDGTPLALHAHLLDPSVNIHQAPSPIATRLATIALEQDELSVSVLQSMPTPSDIDLHNLSQHYIMGASGYWRGDDETTLFGDKKAENDWLDVSLKNGLSSDLRSFLSDHFSKSLLVRSLATDDTYKDKFSDNDRDKLTFWWQGKVSLPIYNRALEGRPAIHTDISAGASLPFTILAI